MSDLRLDAAFQATRTFLEAALEDLDTTKELADRGDHTGALVQIAMGLRSRLNHAEVELGGVIERLEALGGQYPPPPP